MLYTCGCFCVGGVWAGQDKGAGEQGERNGRAVATVSYTLSPSTIHIHDFLPQTSRQAYAMQQLQEELERYKDLVATLETSIARKDQLIASLNTSIEKQVNSLDPAYLSTCLQGFPIIYYLPPTPGYPNNVYHLLYH